MLARATAPWLALVLSRAHARSASPVAGAFLALAFLAWALAGPAAGVAARHSPLAALAPIALLAVRVPEGGTQPFVASAFYPALVGVLVIARADAEPRAARCCAVGTLLYALALLGAYLVPSAVGGNVDRLGALAAGPVAALRARLRLARGAARALLVLAPFLLYWQVNAPVADFASARLEPVASTPPTTRRCSASCAALGIGYGARPARIEVVATRDHWEARWRRSRT